MQYKETNSWILWLLKKFRAIIIKATREKLNITYIDIVQIGTKLCNSEDFLQKD